MEYMEMIGALGAIAVIMVASYRLKRQLKKIFAT